jgi:hypothetical protein
VITAISPSFAISDITNSKSRSLACPMASTIEPVPIHSSVNFEGGRLTARGGFAVNFIPG